MQNRHLDALVRDQAPVMLDPRGSVQTACARMRDRRVGCVLVVDHGRLVGIFTGRDAVALLAGGRGPAGLTMAEVMTRAPVTLGPQASALDALRCMQDGGFRHVPIVEDGRVLGVVSRGDFRAVEHSRLDDETGLWERI